MPDYRTYLKWCLKQSKGIRTVGPSENLVKAYVQKSRTALKSMELNAKEGIYEWALSASYYARYFAVYALLQKIGVKCEIHDCTIALFSYLLHGSIPPGLVKQLKQSKDERVEAQYYTGKIDVDEQELIHSAKSFVLEIEKLIDSLNPEKIVSLQKRLRELASVEGKRR